MKLDVGLVLTISVCLLLSSCGSGGSDSNTVGNTSGPDVGGNPPGSTVVDNLGLGDVAGNESFQFSNNSALLSGPVFGSNDVASVELRKGIDFEIVGDTTDIVTERVVIVREENNPSVPFVVAYIRNNTDTVRCGILFDDIEIIHGDGEAFQVVQHFFSSGGVNDKGNNGSGVVSNCLPAGGNGYHVIAGSGQGLYDEVSKVRFSVASGFNISGEFQSLPGSVRAVSYNVETAPDGLITLYVSVQNNLARTIRIAPPNVFALDEKGQPLMYSAAGLESTVEAFTIESGETKVVTVLMYLSGQASTIRASVSFSYPLE